MTKWKQLLCVTRKPSKNADDEDDNTNCFPLQCLPSHLVLTIFAKIPAKCGLRMRQTCTAVDELIETSNFRFDGEFVLASCVRGRITVFEIHDSREQVTKNTNPRPISDPYAQVRCVKLDVLYVECPFVTEGSAFRSVQEMEFRKYEQTEWPDILTAITKLRIRCNFLWLKALSDRMTKQIASVVTFIDFRRWHWVDEQLSVLHMPQLQHCRSIFFYCNYFPPKHASSILNFEHAEVDRWLKEGAAHNYLDVLTPVLKVVQEKRTFRMKRLVVEFLHNDDRPALGWEREWPETILLWENVHSLNRTTFSMQPASIRMMFTATKLVLIKIGESRHNKIRTQQVAMFIDSPVELPDILANDIIPLMYPSNPFDLSFFADIVLSCTYDSLPEVVTQLWNPDFLN